MRASRIFGVVAAGLAALSGVGAGVAYVAGDFGSAGAPAARPGSRAGAATAAAARGAAIGANAAMVATTPAGWAEAIRAEDARAGSPGWKVGAARGNRPGLEAYADRVSVLPGQPVGLYVNVKVAGPVTVRAFRMGWYGGSGARLVWSGTAAAHPQPRAATLNAALADAGGMRATGAALAPWHLTTLVSTAGWPEGDYLFRLDTALASRYVPVTVRSADAHGRVLLVAGTMTWQAYNLWGGRSLYKSAPGSSAGRSFAVSYDRPYAGEFGAGHFLRFDLGLAQVGERSALPLAWTTDYDLARDPGLLAGAAAVVFGGHAEYWTGALHDAVIAAVGRGTNLAVFGANTSYWRVRLAGRAIGVPGQPSRRDGAPRIVVGAKDASMDPLARSDPGGATARFRDPPGARPEELLTGMRYDCFPASAPWTVSDPTWWGYAGAGLHAGEAFPGVVAPESDRVYPAADRPKPMSVVAYSRFSCRGHLTAQTSVYWVAPSGAGVFDAGTMNWVCAAALECTVPQPQRAGAVLARVTQTILAGFDVARAGVRHPARDTVSRYWLPAGNTTGAA